MAKVLTPMQSQAVSGKVISAIHQAWRGLNVIRRFTMPTIRHTPSQMARRGNFGALSVAWKNDLTIAERLTWNAYDPGLKDLWGNPINPTGLNVYQQICGILKDAGKTLLTEAPLTSAMASPVVTPTFTTGVSEIAIAEASAGEITEYAPFCDVWVAGISSDEGTVTNTTTINTTGIVPSINPAKNQYRHVAFIDENSASAQVVEFKSVSGGVLPGGIKIAVIVIRYTKDGLGSVAVRLTGITVA